jgi:hypothetical protein
MIHAFAPTFRSRKPISVRADNHGCVLVAVVWLVMSTTGATFAQNQPPPPLFATPKNLKTTDCFEKYLGTSKNRTGAGRANQIPVLPR